MEIDRQTSNMLKGIAIMLIVLTHAIRNFSMPFLPNGAPAQIGVFTFLFLSGYGIYRSYGLENIDAKKYLYRRFRRVVVPYWAVLTLYLLGLLLFLPSYFTYEAVLSEVARNYFLINLSSYDVLGVGWFVTYIMLWYLIYLGVSMLPLRNEWKMGLMLLGVPGAVYLFAQGAANAIVTAIPYTPAEMLLNSRGLYLPYALAFPLGVLVALRGSWKISLHFMPLEKAGKYSYYIYLLHMGLLCLLFTQGFSTICATCSSEKALLYKVSNPRDSSRRARAPTLTSATNVRHLKGRGRKRVGRVTSTGGTGG